MSDTAHNGPRAQKRRRSAVALAVGLGFPVAMFAVGGVVAHLPLADDTREPLLLAIFLPLRVFIWVIEWFVDTVGPHGRAEPASHYLPHWTVLCALGLAVLLLALTAFWLTYAVMAIVARRRARSASG